MKIFLLTSLLSISALASSVKEYTESKISGCNGISVFKPTSGKIKNVIKPKNSSNIQVSQNKEYVMVSSHSNISFIVITDTDENYRVSFDSKSCQMPSKSYEGCFSKKEKLSFSSEVETIFYPESKSFILNGNQITVSSVNEKYTTLFIHEKGKEITPMLLINKSS